MIVCGWCDKRPALAFFEFWTRKRGKAKRERLYACVRCRPSLARTIEFGEHTGQWHPEESEVVT